MLQGSGTTTVTLTATDSCGNETQVTVDITIECLDALGDFVWEDLNANGIQDAGEPGVPDVPVELFDGAGNPVASTTTDANGEYLFENLLPGDYYVVFTPPGRV